MVGQTRDICFTPEQEFFAKGCHGISGHIRIPTLSENDSNDFITRLFETAKKNITEEQEAFNPKKAAYDNAIAEGKAIIDSVSDLGTANEALMKIAGLSHALTSKKELGLLINNKCKKLGLMYDKVLKRYTELKGDEEQ